VNILKAAIAHNGLAVIDVVSPCVTFNNHDGSTKGYAYSKEHDELLHQIGFVQSYEQIEIEIHPGELREVTLHDGSRILLKRLEEDYDPGDAVQALQRLHRAVEGGQMLTGLVYLRPEKKSFIDLLNVTDQPLNALPLEVTRPPREALDKIMRDLM
jgi:2-oxoglutarate ferredoxin oxidoreductase subunit beta